MRSRALWSVLEEHAELRLRMAKRAEEAGIAAVAEGFAKGARDSHRQAREIRAILFSDSSAPQSPEEEAAKGAAAKGMRKTPRTPR
jgi:hypothetical protein